MKKRRIDDMTSEDGRPAEVGIRPSSKGMERILQKQQTKNRQSPLFYACHRMADFEVTHEAT